MREDDALFRFRVRVFALAHELGVAGACRLMGIHRSTYYRWKRQVDRFGLEVLRPRERRLPRMPNALSPVVEQRIVAFALGHPSCGPDRISAELARPKWGGIRVSSSGVWRALRRHGLQTRSKRYGVIALRMEPGPEKRDPPPEQHLGVSHPGELVQMDCFYIGRLSGTRGAVWQYTAIDVGSAFTWASLYNTPKNPSARWTSLLARRVAVELAACGWKLERVMTDNASEFRAREFRDTLAALAARHTFIHAGRPQTNGCVERVQQTILEECWKPSFARHLIPKYTGLRRDLEGYLRHYDYDRAHTGRWTQGRTPATVLGKAKTWSH